MAAVRRARTISRHSRPNRLATLDKRSCEWRRLQQIRDSYLAHLGGHATVAQLTLIETIATTTLLAEAFERRAFVETGGLMSERDARAYLSLSNARSRAVRSLGLRPVTEPQRSLAELFADAQEEAAA
jgi:hypothetical protein